MASWLFPSPAASTIASPDIHRSNAEPSHRRAATRLSASRAATRMFASRVASCIFPSRATVSPAPASPRFILKKYLVATCGLTRTQAHKASQDIPYLNSPTKPDAVIAYLAGLGFSRRDIASLVTKDPEFLCASTGRILNHVLGGLTALGPWADLEGGPGGQWPTLNFQK
ncbi:hypothetical protein ACQ4PT_021298 [Festuca glaucescens]